MHRKLGRQLARHPEVELIRVRLDVVVGHDRDVRGTRNNERGGVTSAIRIGVARVRDVDREPLVIPELVQVLKNANVAVVQTVAATEDRRPVVSHVPCESGPWTEIVLVTTLGDVDVRNWNGEN